MIYTVQVAAPDYIPAELVGKVLATALDDYDIVVVEVERD